MKNTPPIRYQRKITGMSAILLPMLSTTEIDWPGFRDHVARTADAGLVPAVNMDTGYGNLIDQSLRLAVLKETQDVCAGRPFIAGAFVGDQSGSAFDFDAYKSRMDEILSHEGKPVIFQSFGLTEQSADGVLEAYTQIGAHSGGFYAFELGKMFAPFGAIYDLDVYEKLIQIPECLGAKHSSLNRQLEWQRLAIRDAVRPEFMVLTGNDLAIDMVMYGSDYLLGLSTFAPAEFAKRDAMWESGDNGFYQLNDLLQYLGFLTFRSPVPAYKHNAAQFLKARGWIETSLTFPGSPTRPDSDVALLEEILERLQDEQTTHEDRHARCDRANGHQPTPDPIHLGDHETRRCSTIHG
ncbi:dihydrodipicolinate synthase family protein [Rhodopirellula sp. ICT_H3.1]|uniref:Dihydrodipicolinate synthase family protein n=2 Tax=Aporhodopirellula aestuarii TaxID=2950107 RepID=A0ABT0U0G2_9BACT|nr:dihydrodipicolinate synthase family protein [Aporhodopirellula aestuarii]